MEAPYFPVTPEINILKNIFMTTCVRNNDFVSHSNEKPSENISILHAPESFWVNLYLLPFASGLWKTFHEYNENSESRYIENDYVNKHWSRISVSCCKSATSPFKHPPTVHASRFVSRVFICSSTEEKKKNSGSVSTIFICMFPRVT